MNVLAIGAHPDDIEFGCGGTLLKLRKAGHSVNLLVMTKGESGGAAGCRAQEQQAVADFLGAEGLFWGGFEDTKVPVDSDTINIIDRTIENTSSDMVLFNFWEDTHQDHRALAKCAVSATRHVKMALAFEVPTSDGFEPRMFVDIGDVMDEKMKLLRLHASQLDKTKVPRLMITDSVTACANFRGFQARVKFAEGFMPVRYLMNW
jgi:LmbE family N-acetylglucosaminyl deacetylase